MNRDQLPSLIYWRSSREAVARRFYVSFCLFVSAVQDAFLGMKEREQANLNWSATCSYYGLVHAGRLLAFLSIGDFPRSHKDLGVLFRPQQGVNPPIREATVLLDWLKGLDSAFSTNRRANALHHREILDSYFQSLGINRLDIDQFGRILNAAKPLREDGNYEALLIAHEYEHQVMTTGFKDLANAMSNATLTSISLVRKAFSAYLATDLDLEADRMAYASFLHDYLENRMLEAIRTKLRGSPRVTSAFEEYVNSIHIDYRPHDYSHLNEMVSFSLFGGKLRLMKSFEEKIRRLEQSISDVNG